MPIPDTIISEVPSAARTSTEHEAAPALPRVMSTMEINLSSSILIFTFALIALECALIRSIRINQTNAIRLITVTLILTSILFLTTAGYGSQQITPATGLLGTIAGYLLGRSNGSSGGKGSDNGNGSGNENGSSGGKSKDQTKP